MKNKQIEKALSKKPKKVCPKEFKKLFDDADCISIDDSPLLTNINCDEDMLIIGDDYECGVEDIKEVDNRVYCTLEFTAFDIARFGKDELYKKAENIFAEVGLVLEISKMEMIPLKIEEHFVIYKCIPTDYTRTWSNGDVSKHENGEMITPLHESLLLLIENIMSKSCDYDRSTAIVLPKSFDINRIDARMKELKTNVVNFRGNNYIVGVYDSGYALWECEV